MPYYKLVSSGRSDVILDEIILSRSSTGNVESFVSTETPQELSDEQLSEARKISGRYGYSVVEASEPSQRENQPVGVDVVGQSPIVKQTGESVSADAEGEKKAEEETAQRGSKTKPDSR